MSDFKGEGIWFRKEKSQNQDNGPIHAKALPRNRGAGMDWETIRQVKN